MSRFNKKPAGNKTVNHEGGQAYKMDSALELYSRVCTASLQNKFYESADKAVASIRGLIAKCDPVFVAKLAVYAREKMYLRSVPLVLAVELAKVHRGDDLVKRMITRVIQRPDEITEILSYYAVANGRNGQKKLSKLSNQVKRGVADSFGKFNAYGFAKYNRAGEVTLKDAVKLTHPRPKNEAEAALIKQILDGTLETPNTWEVNLSEAGKSGKSKKVVWEEMIFEGSLGYMALLRNLRNFLKEGVSKEAIMVVAERLADPNQVRKSKQLPFRFLSAYRSVSGGKGNRYLYGRGYGDNSEIVSPFTGILLDAIEKAVTVSIENIPMFKDETVLIASDVSGSMMNPVSPKSSIMNYDIGLLLGMLLKNRCSMAVTGIFGSDWLPVNLPSGNVIANVEKMYEIEGKVGYSTNGYKVIEWANKQNYGFDRICIFCDCQLYGGSIQSEWSRYRQKYPDAKLYLFDLAGFGTSPLSLSGNGVSLISGWSDKVFEVMKAIEEGAKTLDVINMISLD